MAVIQNLPAETIYRILELAAETVRCPWSRKENRRAARERSELLRSTSLVAKAWVHPSQELLVAECDFISSRRSTKGLVRHLKQLSSQPAMKLLALRDTQRLDTILSLTRSVSALILGGKKVIDVSGLTSTNLSKIESLELGGRLQGSLSLDPEVTLPLRVLSWSVLSFDADVVLSTIARAAPRLTSLEIIDSWSDAYQALLPVAPQLRFLCMHNPMEVNISFLAACTSLMSLHVLETTEEILSKSLGQLPARLAVLDTMDIYGNPGSDTDSDFQSGVKRLPHPRPWVHAALGLPCLADLKRWRFGDTMMDLHGERKDVAELCASHGVLLCGSKRYFTDLPY